jgi:hypothetical protein
MIKALFAINKISLGCDGRETGLTQALLKCAVGSENVSGKWHERGLGVILPGRFGLVSGGHGAYTPHCRSVETGADVRLEQGLVKADPVVLCSYRRCDQPQFKDRWRQPPGPHKNQIRKSLPHG